MLANAPLIMQGPVMGTYGASSSAAGTSIGDRSAIVPAMVGLVRIDACNWWIARILFCKNVWLLFNYFIYLIILVGGASLYYCTV